MGQPWKIPISPGCGLSINFGWLEGSTLGAGVGKEDVGHEGEPEGAKRKGRGRQPLPWSEWGRAGGSKKHDGGDKTQDDGDQLGQVIGGLGPAVAFREENGGNTGQGVNRGDEDHVPGESGNR